MPLTAVNSYVIKKRFLQRYKENLGHIAISARETSICRDTFYDWQKNDLKFKKKVEEINKELIDTAERVLITRGINKSDTCLIFWLKKNYPEKYADRVILGGDQFNPINMQMVMPANARIADAEQQSKQIEATDVPAIEHK